MNLKQQAMENHRQRADHEGEKNGSQKYEEGVGVGKKVRIRWRDAKEEERGIKTVKLRRNKKKEVSRTTNK